MVKSEYKKQMRAVLDAMLEQKIDADHDIEMRWLNADDGNTKWHTLFEEDSMARYGLFPFAAEYRIRQIA